MLDQTPTARVQAVLSRLAAALEAGDPAAAAALFAFASMCAGVRGRGGCAVAAATSAKNRIAIMMPPGGRQHCAIVRLRTVLERMRRSSPEMCSSASPALSRSA